MPENVTTPEDTAALLTASKTVIIESDEHDVFGDGTVVIKLAAGHTPGHQVLYVKLVKTGGVVLSGDLYHFPEARTLKRVATFDFDQAQTPVAREKIEAFMTKAGAQLLLLMHRFHSRWHDFKENIGVIGSIVLDIVSNGFF